MAAERVEGSGAEPTLRPHHLASSSRPCRPPGVSCSRGPGLVAQLGQALWPTTLFRADSLIAFSPARGRPASDSGCVPGLPSRFTASCSSPAPPAELATMLWTPNWQVNRDLKACALPPPPPGSPPRRTRLPEAFPAPPRVRGNLAATDALTPGRDAASSRPRPSTSAASSTPNTAPTSRPTSSAPSSVPMRPPSPATLSSALPAGRRPTSSSSMCARRPALTNAATSSPKSSSTRRSRRHSTSTPSLTRRASSSDHVRSRATLSWAGRAWIGRVGTDSPTLFRSQCMASPSRSRIKSISNRTTRQWASRTRSTRPRHRTRRSSA